MCFSWDRCWAQSRQSFVFNSRRNLTLPNKPRDKNDDSLRSPGPMHRQAGAPVTVFPALNDDNTDVRRNIYEALANASTTGPGDDK